MSDFKESGGIEEAADVALHIWQTAKKAPPRISFAKTRDDEKPGYMVQLQRIEGQPLRLIEAGKIGGSSRTGESSAPVLKLTPFQKALAQAGGRMEISDLLVACKFGLKRKSAARRRGERALAAAVAAGEIGQPKEEKGIYTYPPTPNPADKSADIVSATDVGMSADGRSREDKLNVA